MRTKLKTIMALLLGAFLALAVGHGLPPSWIAPVFVLWIPALAAYLWIRESREDSAAPAGAESPFPIAPAVALSAACGAYLISAGAADPSAFLAGWWPHSLSWGWLRKSGLFRFALATAALIPVVRRLHGQKLGRMAAAGWLLATAFCVGCFWIETGGLALYRDDHPSFLFRFWAFARSLPSMAYYNPFWNAGNVETASVSSGVPALGLLFWPCWRIWPSHVVYTAVIAVALAVIVPLLAAGSVRMAGGGRTAAAMAAILALGCGRIFFLWSLHFGTVPASFACAFIMPLCAAMARILRDPHPPRWAAVVMALSLAAFASWPPAAFMAVPAAMAALFSLRHVSRRGFLLLAAGAGAAALLLLPGWWAVIQHANVAGFAQAHTRVGPWREEIIEGFKILRGHLLGANPLIVFLGLGGVVFWPDRSVRRIFGITLAGLVLIAGWGEMVKPQFQLTRAGIPMLLAAVIPAALWMERLLESRRTALAPIRAALLAALALGAYAASNIYRNQSPAPYAVMDRNPRKIAEWIRTRAPADARVMFAGYTVHAFGRGHVAYLPVITGRSMMACDYYHFSTSMREYEYPPRNFREEDEDVFAFLDVYNIGAVLTHHDFWKRFFRKYPDRFEESAAFGETGRSVAFLVRRPPPGWFVRGGGSVTQDINELRVLVTDPSAPCVIRFNWVDGLRPDPPATIRPFDAGRDVRFIEIDPHGQPDIRLRWSQWRRGIVAGDPSTAASP